MAFNVTQCPGCDSTFNTNARMLEMAAGKVRCGACLTVFDASEHYLANDPEHDPIDSEESVFLSDDPQDYFDPSNFLTRSSLTEPDTPSFSAQADSLDEVELSEEIIPEIDKGEKEEIDDVFADAAKGFQPADAIEEEQQQEIESNFESGEESSEVIMLDDFEIEDTPSAPANYHLENPVSENQDAENPDLENIEIEIHHDDFFVPEQESAPPRPAVTEITPAAQPKEIPLQAKLEQETEQESAQQQIESGDFEQTPSSMAKTIVDPPKTMVLNPTGFKHAFSFSFGESTRKTESDEPSQTESATELFSNPDDPNEAAKDSEAGVNEELEFEKAIENSIESSADSSIDNAIEDPIERSFEEVFIESPAEPAVFDEASMKEASEEEIADAPEARAANDKELEQYERDLNRVLNGEPAVAESRKVQEEQEEQEEQETIETVVPEDDKDFHEIVTQFSEPAEEESDTVEQDELLEAITGETTAEAVSETTVENTLVTAQETTQETTTESNRTLIDDFDTDPDDKDVPTLDREAVDYDSSDSIRARALKTKLQDDNALEEIPEEHLKVLKEFSTPLELKKGQRSRWGRNVFLSLSVLLLCTSLAAQYFWTNFAVYSQLASTRPYYEFACQWLECELGEYSEIDAIRSDNLVVRSHPELANGLMVNISIRNTAGFPQAFPILILSFNTANGEMIALREFAPDEYLDPGLRDIEMMPVMAPVQIQLEIMDPGRDAVNYTLAFRRP